MLSDVGFILAEMLVRRRWCGNDDNSPMPRCKSSHFEVNLLTYVHAAVAFCWTCNVLDLQCVGRIPLFEFCFLSTPFSRVCAAIEVSTYVAASYLDCCTTFAYEFHDGDISQKSAPEVCSRYEATFDSLKRIFNNKTKKEHFRFRRT